MKDSSENVANSAVVKNTVVGDEVLRVSSKTVMFQCKKEPVKSSSKTGRFRCKNETVKSPESMLLRRDYAINKYRQNGCYEPVKIIEISVENELVKVPTIII